MLPTPGTKPRREAIRDLIIRLCCWRPLASGEIAGLLGRKDRKPLVRDYLSPMVRSGDLEYTIPEMPDHPNQKYKTPD